ncbi:CPBP family intramembrane glutamic endopeptidase [Falsarthrobacter nasiphocae]|uniref:Membrane protease YdiL (CAAX protease family) n=1 Tax=Falsarthrobacter nasiphocae TaxID=189863 RepID=A0AAE3YIZ8_9MICC|nr:CPBP family intramembrane glutamic endopeptidase [Falsarthrobacter nasiphocae]MDR6892606.1 membrane protease YdiL (CAAX protease family) [Falsarthrobacter nasiphocae]
MPSTARPAELPLHDERGPVSRRARRLIGWEIGIVLCLSLGRSAVFSVLDLIEALTGGTLADQTVTLNAPTAASPVLDAIRQTALILFSLAPVALVIFLAGPGLRGALARLGLAAPRGRGGAARDVVGGLGLFLLIGLGTLGVYAAGRALGVTARLNPSGLSLEWWNHGILLLSAVRHGLLEEIIMIGYLFWRGRQMGWGPAQVIVGSAILRGLYHSYQGVGPIAGNLAMGIIFGVIYSRTGRLAPLIVAHVLLDATAFFAASWYARL